MHYRKSVKTNNDLTILTTRLLDKSFPELGCNTKIQIAFRNVDGGLIIYDRMRNDYIIDVDPVLRGKTQPIIGGIAHELCHIVYDHSLSRQRSWLDQFAYNHSERFRDLDERNTDIETIIRGYGLELLDLMLIYFDYPKTQGIKYFGLTAGDILQIQGSLHAKT